MKIVRIFGKEIGNEVNRVRLTGRAVIKEKDFFLFSYLSKRKQFLLPGGGVDEGESIQEAIKREVLEECGLLTDVEEPFLLIEERYGSMLWQTYYSRAKIIEKRSPMMEESEINVGLVSKWASLDELYNERESTIGFSDVKEKKIDILGAVLNSHYREAIAVAISENIKPNWSIPKRLMNIIGGVEHD